jgi:hypothetical protein
MEILTEKGFKNFQGILNQGIPERLLHFKFFGGTEIKVTPEHKFLIDNNWIYADLLDVGDYISDKEIIEILEIEPENVYDMYEVEDTHSYWANGVINHNCNLIMIDEAAIIPNNIAEQFFAATYPVISSGKTTKIIMASTPLGYNHFWKFWNDAEQGRNDFVPFTVPYWKVPGRDEKWADEQKRLLGEVKFNQEVLCIAGDSEITLKNKETGEIFTTNIEQFVELLKK